MKIGVNISIDVTKVDKTRLKDGKYLNMTAFIDPNNPGKYGDHGMITENTSKEERDQGIKGTILGNAKVFWKDGQQAAHQQGVAQAQQAAAPVYDFDDDIPF